MERGQSPKAKQITVGQVATSQIKINVYRTPGLTKLEKEWLFIVEVNDLEIYIGLVLLTRSLQYFEDRCQFIWHGMLHPHGSSDLEMPEKSIGGRGRTSRGATTA